MTCAAGCSSGHCNASGWKAIPSNTTNDLLAVFGTSDHDVWAVGRNATAIHFDGVSWTATTTGVESIRDIISVQGDAPDNIFIVSDMGLLERWNGHSWEVRADLGNGGNANCMFAIGPDDVLVAHTSDYEVRLSRVTHGVVQELGTVYEKYAPNGAPLWPGCHIAARSPQDVWIVASMVFHFDGTALTEDLNAPVSRWLHFDGSALYASGLSDIGVRTGTTWSLLPKPGGSSGAFRGPPGGPFFALAAPAVGTPFYSQVSKWNGSTWTPQSIPSIGNEDLLDQWVSPTGTAFVVGTGGLVLQGP